MQKMSHSAESSRVELNFIIQLGSLLSDDCGESNQRSRKALRSNPCGNEDENEDDEDGQCYYAMAEDQSL